jgi:LmbE family N-acetylglucosaminyl deacetylase
MKLGNKAVIHIPSGEPQERELARTTQLAISAHQDDIEVMAQQGILACYQKPDCGFAAVVVTNGSGSPRVGPYADYTDGQMMEVRQQEQMRASDIGAYSVLVMLGHPSSAVKKKGNPEVLEDLCAVIRATRPEVIYTHNLADKHLTHIGVAMRVIEAIRLLEPEERPHRLYGCEVWRSLDWMNDDEKTVFDLSGHPHLRLELISVFESQVAGGKRYDLATLGRQSANATFFASHDVDHMEAATYAMDLTPLMAGGDIAGYVSGYIDRFSRQVLSGLDAVNRD